MAHPDRPLSQVAAVAAAAQQHLQQQHAQLQSGTFLRPNFYHHNSPLQRNIWNQRSLLNQTFGKAKICVN
ncbi:ETS transcription factor E74A [Anopheles sinensis]|uniref:ETS transcription factor E74A n=1 Tax=Anopheles sinensis TaxID=74873 RepID=A0A084WS46_ANOSI|nr:ETS transcription factor E74A [Anopheles sinensis]